MVVPDEDNLRVLRTQTGRLQRLSDDIAAVSRAEEHQLDVHIRPVAPADLVDAAVAAARPRYVDHGVDLSGHADADLPAVSADRIGQALANLLDNALRHTPRGGRVTISAKAGRGAVELIVADTGAGIVGEHLPHLFERFYRADPARDRAHGGSGIGLAIVRAVAVAAAHGGRVSADSPGPGQGATFVISLPTADTGDLPSGRRHPAGTRRPNEHVRTRSDAPQSTEDPVQHAIERLVAHRSALHITASRVADPQVRTDLHTHIDEVDAIVRDVQAVVAGRPPGERHPPADAQAGRNQRRAR